MVLWICGDHVHNLTDLVNNLGQVAIQGFFGAWGILDINGCFNGVGIYDLKGGLNVWGSYGKVSYCLFSVREGGGFSSTPCDFQTNTTTAVCLLPQVYLHKRETILVYNKWSHIKSKKYINLVLVE